MFARNGVMIVFKKRSVSFWLTLPDKWEFIQFVLRLFLPKPLELRQIHDLDIAQFHRLSGPYPFFTNYSPILHVFQHERNNP